MGWSCFLGIPRISWPLTNMPQESRLLQSSEVSGRGWTLHMIHPLPFGRLGGFSFSANTTKYIMWLHKISKQDNQLSASLEEGGGGIRLHLYFIW